MAILASMIGQIARSVVDGPGERAVVHFAGCSIGCAGCFNPHTHDEAGPGVWRVSPEEMALATLRVSQRVTVSGGEPTDQPIALRAYLRALRALGVVDVVMFTGRRVGWLERHVPAWRDIVREGLVDIVIDGPFMRNRMEVGDVVRGSSNQRVIALTSRIPVEAMTGRDTQVEIAADGSVILTGFPDADLLNLMSELGAIPARSGA